MDDLIEGSNQQQKMELLILDIQNYIQEKRYTWTPEQIFQQYEKRKEGSYISHTAEDVISKFESELKEVL